MAFMAFMAWPWHGIPLAPDGREPNGSGRSGGCRAFGSVQLPASWASQGGREFCHGIVGILQRNQNKVDCFRLLKALLCEVCKPLKCAGEAISCAAALQERHLLAKRHSASAVLQHPIFGWWKSLELESYWNPWNFQCSPLWSDDFYGGVSEKFIKASAISSTSIEESHIQQWSKVMARRRPQMNPSHVLSPFTYVSLQYCLDIVYIMFT